jgi:hypothetical protein
MLAPTKYEVPSLQALSRLLRDESSWPPGFEFNFDSCTTCAMALAFTQWHLPLINEVVGCSSKMATLMGISFEDSLRLFVDAAYHRIPLRGSSRITPEEVADAIDQYLEDVTEEALADATA